MLKKILAIALAVVAVTCVCVSASAWDPEVLDWISDPDANRTFTGKDFKWEAGDEYGPFGFSKSDWGLSEDDEIPEYLLDNHGNLNWYFGSWARKLEFVTDEGHNEAGCYKFPKGESYRAFYIWTRVYDVGDYKWSFWVKGKAGTELWVDLEGNCNFDIIPFSLETDDWEFHEIDFTPFTPYPEEGQPYNYPGAPEGHGVMIRLYINGHPEYEDFYIDDMTLECITPREPTVVIEDPPREYDPDNGGLMQTVFQFKITDWEWDSWGEGGAEYEKQTGHMGLGCVRLAGGTDHRALVFWTHIADSDEYTVSFWAKGTAGQTIRFGNEQGKFEDQTYTFSSKKWEHVQFTFSVEDPSDSPATTGYSARIYTDDPEVGDFYVDELVLMKASSGDTSESAAPATESAEVTGPDAVTTENAAQSEKTVSAGLIIGIAAAAVVIAAAVVVIIAKKKK